MLQDHACYLGGILDQYLKCHFRVLFFERVGHAGQNIGARYGACPYNQLSLHTRPRRRDFFPDAAQVVKKLQRSRIQQVCFGSRHD